MLEVKSLYFRHKKADKDVLKNVSFSAEKGMLTTVLGANGSGKSTLFRCICGVWKHYAGSVLINGENISNKSFKDRIKYFAVVPQHHEPPFPYSVLQVVVMGRIKHLGIFSSPTKKDFEIAEEILKDLGIYHLKDTPYTSISGGERQLVLIARALAQEAPVMLLDEPTSHLDFKNQILIMDKIKKLAQSKKTVVLVSLHDPNLALFFSDRVVLLKNGEVFAHGNIADTLNSENLKKIYGISVKLVSANGYKLVIPEIVIDQE